MLNTTSNTAAQSLNIANVLLDAHWQKAGEGVNGAIFSPAFFAKDWDSVYVKPFVLPVGEVDKNMRKLVEPTLVITQKKAKMAYVLASKETPVYLPNEYKKDPEFGFIMAFRLAPIISEEYVYYMSQFDSWVRLLNHNIEQNDGYGMSWNDVGTGGDVSVVNGIMYETPFLTAEDLVRNIGNIEIPSLSVQQELVGAAKGKCQTMHQLSAPSEKELKELVDSSLTSSALFGDSIFKYAKSRIGLLRELYKRAAGDQSDSKVIEILSNNEFPFKVDPSNIKDLDVLSNHLSSVFPMLVNPSEFSWSSSPEYLQPKEVTDFIIEVAHIPPVVKVFNPFAGLSSYAVALPNNPVVGEEINMITWAVGQIRIFANGLDANIANEDAFTEIEAETKYPVIITSPAYLTEKGHEIQDIVEQLYAKLTDKGRLICLVPHSFVFSNNRKVKSLRERLIQERSIKGVISLPANIFPGTGIIQDILFIEKDNTEDDIVFADASGFTRFAKSSYRATTFDWEPFVNEMEDNLADFDGVVHEGDVATIVKYKDIIASNLTPEFYLALKPKDGKPLSDFATEIKECCGDGNTEYNLVGSSLPEALHRKPFAPQKCVEKKATSARNHVAISGDAVLIAIVSGKVRTVFVENFHDKIAFPPGFIKVLQPAEGVSAQYLAALLSTKMVADQITAQAKGLTIPRLNRLELSQVVVPDYQTEEERQKLINDVLTSEMGDMALELHEAHERYKREVRSTRHAMIQTLSALSSNWQQMNMFAKKKGGQISFNDIVGRVNPISVEDLMGSIGYAISTLERQVESLRLEKADWGEEVEINPYGFIEDYIRTHSTPNVRLVNVGNDNTADIPDINEETGDVTYYHTDAMNVFTAPMRLVERIFNNIVANAKAHGFTSDKSDNEIRFDWQEVHGDIVITIANNGLPLKEGVTSDDVLMRGFSTAFNESSSDGTLHSGQGGYEIKSLMEGLGSVEVKSEPDAEFPVIYRLTFTNTNTVRIL